MTDFDRLTTVFRMVFADPTIVITSETTANDIEAWDSLSHIILISAIEEEFGIEFSQREVIKFKTVGDLLNSIKTKIN